MNSEQQYVFEQIVSGKNVFMTGPGGTGKSYVIHRIREWCIQEQIPHLVTAMTGSAAILIEGKTLHSALGIGLGDSTPSQLAQAIKYKRPTITQTLRMLKLLIIDEVSMLNADLFEKIDAVLRIIRNHSAPFGGIQVVLSGDLFQLPPVEGGYCFESPRWPHCIHHVCTLKTMVRQTGEFAFQTMLMNLREGKCTVEYLQRLEQCKNTRFPSDIQPTVLFSTRADVVGMNQRAYSKLIQKGAKSHVYPTVYSCPRARAWAEAVGLPEQMEFCVGAQVVITYNIDQSAGVVNGTRGVVVDLAPTHVSIKLLSGQIIPVYPMAREYTDGMETFRKKKTTATTTTASITESLPDSKDAVDAESETPTADTDTTSEETEDTTPDATTKPKRKSGSKYTVTMLPLTYAWALTIHKSQGMTLDAVVLDLGPSIFSPGQAYTAISRVRNMKSLCITNLYSSCFRADPKVVRFYNGTYVYPEQEVPDSLPAPVPIASSSSSVPPVSQARLPANTKAMKGYDLRAYMTSIKK